MLLILTELMLTEQGAIGFSSADAAAEVPRLWYRMFSLGLRLSIALAVCRS